MFLQHRSLQAYHSNGDFGEREEDTFGHLSELCVLENLTAIDITAADFFGHSIFQLLELRGDQLRVLVLNNADEMNLNAVILIGDRCPNLEKLSLIKCHYQIEVDDPQAVDRLVKERTQDVNKDCLSTKCGRSPGKIFANQ